MFFERVDHLVAADAGSGETEFEVEQLGRRPVGEHEVLRPARLGLGGGGADLLARGAALAGDFLDQGGHFLGCLLPNYLQQQGLGRNVGQPTQSCRTSSGIPISASDSVIDVRDFPSRLRQVLVRVAAAVGQAVQRFRLLERRQILALQVLDQRELDDLGVVDLADDHRQLAQAGPHRRLVAALAGHDLKAVAALADDQRLDDPLLADRGDELRQVAHDLPRLVRVRIDELDRHHPADRRPGRRGQRLDVVLIVAHRNRLRQSSSRHDR